MHCYHLKELVLFYWLTFLWEPLDIPNLKLQGRNIWIQCMSFENVLLNQKLKNKVMLLRRATFTSDPPFRSASCPWKILLRGCKQITWALKSQLKLLHTYNLKGAKNNAGWLLGEQQVNYYRKKKMVSRISDLYPNLPTQLTGLRPISSGLTLKTSPKPLCLRYSNWRQVSHVAKFSRNPHRTLPVTTEL